MIVKSAYMDTSKKFERLIWQDFKDTPNYDKVKYQLERVRATMGASNPCFLEMPVMRQYKYCITICMIALQTSQKDLRQLSLTKNRNEVFPYSMDEGYQKPVVIDVDKRLL